MVSHALAVNKGHAYLSRVSVIDMHSFHGKRIFLSFDFDRKPEGVASAKQDVRVPQAPLNQGQSGGQTSYVLSGYDPVDLRPPPTSRRPSGRGVSFRVCVCWRI